jgi:hypothetical protein
MLILDFLRSVLDLWRYRCLKRSFKRRLIESLQTDTAWELGSCGKLIKHDAVAVEPTGEVQFRVDYGEAGHAEADVHLSFLCRCCVRRAYRTRLLKMAGAALSLVSCVTGCRGGLTPPEATPLELATAMAAPAAIYAMMDFEAAPAPTPPAPAPNERCERCNGTGKIKPDGRIEVICPDCDGDGKTSTVVNQAWRTVQYQQAKCERRIRDLLQQIAASRPKKAPPLRPVPLETGISWETDLTAARNKARERGVPLLIHWYATWCGPCQRMDREVFTDPDVISLLNGQFVPVHLDVDKADPLLKKNWGINQVPTDIACENDYSRAMRFDPTSDPKRYRSQLQEAIQRFKREPTPAAPKPQPQQTSRVIQYVEPVYFEQIPAYYTVPYYGGGAWTNGFTGGSFMGGGCGPGGCW